MDMSLGVILFFRLNTRENIITYLMFVVVQALQYSSGLYFVELVAGKKRDVQKLILLK